MLRTHVGVECLRVCEALDELRRRVIYSRMCLVAGFCVCWCYHEQLFAIMQKPITTALANHHMQPALVYLNPTDPMWRNFRYSILVIFILPR